MCAACPDREGGYRKSPLEPTTLGGALGLFLLLLSSQAAWFLEEPRAPGSAPATREAQAGPSPLTDSLRCTREGLLKAPCVSGDSGAST